MRIRQDFSKEVMLTLRANTEMRRSQETSKKFSSTFCYLPGILNISVSSERLLYLMLYHIFDDFNVHAEGPSHIQTFISLLPQHQWLLPISSFKNTWTYQWQANISQCLSYWILWTFNYAVFLNFIFNLCQNKTSKKKIR